MTILPVKSKQQQRAEAEVADFKNDLGPFVVATEATRTAMAFTDARARDNPFIFVNNSFLALTGFAREDVLGQSFRFIMAHPEDEKGRALLNSEFNESSDFSAEMCFRRKDGSTFWAAVFVCPVRDKDGLTVQYFASFVDVTEQREEQTQSKMLMDELNHRVKNTLATVQSIIWHALRIPSDRNTIREAIEPRLFAMARSHDLLTRENWKSVGLLDVVRDTLDPFEVAIGKKDRINIAGTNTRFPPKSAMALAIAFNELATNAVKFGALSNEAGSVHIDNRLEHMPNGDQLVITWREKDGPPVVAPDYNGFGSRVLGHGLAHELGGKVDLNYLPTGLVCTMNFPLPVTSDE